MKSSNVVHIDPYNQGRKAYFKGIEPKDNPYRHMAFSPHYHQWMAGWDDASLEPAKREHAHVYLSRAKTSH
jgi:hypothetical protein